MFQGACKNCYEVDMIMYLCSIGDINRETGRWSTVGDATQQEEVTEDKEEVLFM